MPNKMDFLILDGQFLTSLQDTNVFPQKDNILIFENTKKDTYYLKSIEKIKKEVSVPNFNF